MAGRLAAIRNGGAAAGRHRRGRLRRNPGNKPHARRRLAHAHRRHCHCANRHRTQPNRRFGNAANRRCRNPANSDCESAANRLRHAAARRLNRNPGGPNPDGETE